MFDDYIEKIKDEIINSTCELIRIPSVLSPSSNLDMPFGENCAKALEYALELGKKLGFKTKNIDGYCGYVEFGEGKELLGIIGHLDIVPEGENWTYPPFNGIIANNKIYGRGAIDDKGPVVASLYAMKAVMDNCTVNKRVRLILGLNEENDWKCIDYYKAHEEHPNISFSPDADFPCIYAEKALLNVHLYQKYDMNNVINIENIDYGNNAINVVPKYCKIILNIDNNIDIDDCIKNLSSIIDNYSYKMEISKLDSAHISVISYGIAAHAAHPDFGINAISRLLVVLYDLFKIYNIDIEIISSLYNYINTEFDGKSLGINFSDESGNLTLNVAKLYIKDNNICVSMNLRIPINTPIDNVKNKFNELYRDSSVSVFYNGEKDALYIPKDNTLVTTLCKIFNEHTNTNAKPIAIGGATYARAFNNCISFGANMPGDKDMCHQIDEYISIDNLILSCKIYADAIYELSL